MNLPPAVIFINSDELTLRPDGYFQDGYQVDGDGYINDLTRTILETQLFIDETMTYPEFNLRVLNDPNYATVVRLQGKRIMVILNDFRNHVNRDLADLVLFYTHGQVVVEKNKFGPPGLSLPADRINIYSLLREVGSRYVTILPAIASKPPKTC